MLEAKIWVEKFFLDNIFHIYHHLMRMSMIRFWNWIPKQHCYLVSFIQTNG